MTQALMQSDDAASSAPFRPRRRDGVAVRRQRGGSAGPAPRAPRAKIGKDASEARRAASSASTSPTPRKQMALAGVNRNLDSYEQLRKLDVPLDTEPAITFRPYLPGKTSDAAAPTPRREAATSRGRRASA